VGVPIYLAIIRARGCEPNAMLMMTNVAHEGGIRAAAFFSFYLSFFFLFLISGRMPRWHECVKYARESSSEFNYRSRAVDAGTLLITIVTPAKILTILLRIRFIPRNEPEK